MSRHYFQFKLPDGRKKFQTSTGGIVSIVLGILLLTTAVTQFMVFWDRTDYSIRESSQKPKEESVTDGCNSSKCVNKRTGFAVAAAYTGYGDSMDSEDTEVGEIKFVIKHWDDSTQAP